MTDDDLAGEQEHAVRIARHAFDHEVEDYGIGDGMHRRPLDPAYVHEPAYLAGHRAGLAMPTVTFTAWDTEDNQETEDAGQAFWRCHGYTAAGEDGWTLDVWPDEPGWTWDVTWTGEYVGDEPPYQMGHADSEDDAQEAAEAACARMEVERLAACGADAP